MKEKPKKILQYSLKKLAQWVLGKYNPKIIAITGSIGKSSAKEAISLVLATKFRVRANIKNYNNEIGLPLTILGVKSPGKAYFAWLKVLGKALRLILIKDKTYPEIIVLEMGVDRIGDMNYLLSIVKPDIGVVTAVSHSHLEYFGSINNIKKEKQALIEALPKNGLAVLNLDSEPVQEIAQASPAPVLSYGLKEEGLDFKAQDIVYNFTKGDYDLLGINFKLQAQGSVVPVQMKNVISDPAIYAVLSAFAIASHLGLSLLEVATALRDFTLPPGRMNILAGVKHSFLIDDTYNSSPEASLSALEILGKMTIGEHNYKYAVLGEMLEIGVYSEEGHFKVGEKVVAEKIDYLIAVGERARDILRGAESAGMSKDKLFYFNYSTEVGKFIQDRIKAGDLLLLKGSQGVRMELVVKELMAEPERAGELLVRQDEAWLKDIR